MCDKKLGSGVWERGQVVRQVVDLLIVFVFFVTGWLTITNVHVLVSPNANLQLLFLHFLVNSFKGFTDVLCPNGRVIC